MPKLIINVEGSGQRVMEVDESAVVLEKEALVWDEREDGDLVIDDKKIGAYKKVNDVLVEDAAQKKWHDDTVAEVKAKEAYYERKQENKKQVKAEFAARILDPKDLTPEEASYFMRKIMELYA